MFLTGEKVSELKIKLEASQDDYKQDLSLNRSADYNAGVVQGYTEILQMNSQGANLTDFHTAFGSRAKQQKEKPSELWRGVLSVYTKLRKDLVG